MIIGAWNLKSAKQAQRVNSEREHHSNETCNAVVRNRSEFRFREPKERSERGRRQTPAYSIRDDRIAENFDNLLYPKAADTQNNNHLHGNYLPFLPPDVPLPPPPPPPVEPGSPLEPPVTPNA